MTDRMRDRELGRDRDLGRDPELRRDPELGEITFERVHAMM